jgi:endonuclease/exonuclease/phosphatase family metal-dependent hydrolase
MNRLTIADWNVGGCRVLDEEDASTREDIGYFARQLLDSDADIVFVQEAHNYPGGGGASQVELLAQEAGYPYFATHATSISHLDPDAQLALGILSRFPLNRTEYSQIPTPPLTVRRNGQSRRLFPRGYLTAVVDDLGIALFCAHAHPFHHFDRDALDPEFSECWTSIDRQLADLVASPVVAGIDLNDGRYQSVLGESLAAGVTVAFQAPTTPTGVQQDYVCFSREAFTVIEREVTPTLADHHLIRVVLEPTPVTPRSEEGGALEDFVGNAGQSAD